MCAVIHPVEEDKQLQEWLVVDCSPSKFDRLALYHYQQKGFGTVTVTTAMKEMPLPTYEAQVMSFTNISSGGNGSAKIKLRNTLTFILSQYIPSHFHPLPTLF